MLIIFRTDSDDMIFDENNYNFDSGADADADADAVSIYFRFLCRDADSDKIPIGFASGLKEIMFF